MPNKVKMDIIFRLILTCLLVYVSSSFDLEPLTPESCPSEDHSTNTCWEMTTKNTSCLIFNITFGCREELGFRSHSSPGICIEVKQENCTVTTCNMECCEGWAMDNHGSCSENADKGINCENGGTRTMWNTCVCVDGFSGKNCEQVDCLFPCLNGGTCTQTTSGNKCNCPEPFYGPVCADVKDNCSGGCLNGGKCILSDTKTICLCKDGFYGKNCAYTIKENHHCPFPNHTVCLEPQCNDGCINDGDCGTDLVCCNDGCCNTCVKPEADVTCFYENGLYQPGEVFKKNHCTLCQCSMKGEVHCTSMSCPPRLPCEPDHVTHPVDSCCPICDIHRPPSIYSQPERRDVYFKPGESVTLPCIARGTPQPKYRWERNGYDFEPSGLDNRVEQLLGQGTLVFNSPEEKDEGFFQCFADNGYGVSTSSKIYLREAKLARFASEEKRVHRVQAGDSLTLSCYPPRSVPWAYIYWIVREPDGRWTPITYGERVTMDLTGRLRITNVKSGDELGGRSYSCMATNYFIRDNTIGPEHVIQVMGDGAEMKNPAQELWTSPAEQLFLKGQTLRLQCIFSGNPTPDVFWKKIDADLPDRVEIKSFGHTLEIKDLAYSGAGEYVCEGSNPLTTQPVSKNFHIRIRSAPHWITKPESQERRVGENTTFICKAGGTPEPTYKWYINGVPYENVQYSHGTRMFKPNANQLTITGLSLKDSMGVQCNASNINGYVFADFSLNVLDDDHLPPEYRPPQINCPGVGILTVSSFSSTAYVYGQDVKAYDYQNKSLVVSYHPHSLKHCKCPLAHRDRKLVIASTMDKYGGTADCHFNVLVIDKTPPIFRTCPADIYAMEDEDVFWDAPIVYDNVKVKSVTMEPIIWGPDRKYSIGNHTMTYRATDYDENMAFCQFTIFIFEKDTPPSQMPPGLSRRHKDFTQGVQIIAGCLTFVFVLITAVLLFCFVRRWRAHRAQQIRNRQNREVQTVSNGLYDSVKDYFGASVKLPPYSPPSAPPVYEELAVNAGSAESELPPKYEEVPPQPPATDNSYDNTVYDNAFDAEDGARDGQNWQLPDTRNPVSRNAESAPVEQGRETNV